MDDSCLIQRKVLRTAVTKTIKELDTCIAANNVKEASLAFSILEEKSRRLFENDEKVIQYLSSTTGETTKGKASSSAEIIETEFERCENYRDDFTSAKLRFEEFLQSCVNRNKPKDSTDRISINLPKLELSTFDGNPKNWFSFWTMFQKIDDDPKLEDDIKFAYLMQATEGKAFDFVQSYQVSKNEYKSAIKNLKARFADDKMLIELYVRELLKLILNQSQNMPFINLVDQLDAHLRCLENLGVTKEKYACMLYPLVEASIPEHILIAWERERNSTSRSGNMNNDLELLMQFLRNEVIGSERIRIAKGFCSMDKTKVDKINKTESDRKINSAPLAPTAAALTTQTETDARRGYDRRNRAELYCLFCEKPTHRSRDCFTAQKFTLKERRDKVLRARGCLSCLRINCRADKCTMSLRCIVCTKKHYPILFPNLSKGEESVACINKIETNSVVSHSSSHSADVLLQTLQIKVSGPSRSKIVRFLCDSASQRSYIARDVAEYLNLKHDHSEFLTHSLFGGIETEKIKHSALKCELQEIRGNFSCEVVLLDKETICGTIPKISKIDTKCFTKLGIYLSDSENDNSDISVLIGADYLGKLLTGCISQQPNGLTAVQTYLGWVVMGKSESSKTSSTHAMPIISLHSASKICDLWSLDILGIRDPVENKTKTEIDSETLSFFEKTVKFRDGRYEVNLPWIEGHPNLSDLRDHSEKRLGSMTSKLIANGKFESYDNIFKEWEQKGIIELVSVNEKENEMTCRYLPHRAVFKESSLTTKLRPVFDTSSKDENAVSLNISGIPTFYWTDSKVVLCWIKNTGTWKTFVNNRIKEIHSSSSQDDWYYVPSQMNAADIASRGCNAQTLFCLRWWEGPKWLENRDSWPKTENCDFSDALELATTELKPIVTSSISLNNSASNFFDWTNRVSKFSTIVRILAYVKRFISNAKSLINNRSETILKGNLANEEIAQSELEIFIYIQRETFGKNRKLIPPNFVIYQDSNGILRVETKLIFTGDDDFFRRPILLPDKHELVFKLIEETHRTFNHVGVQTLVTILRERYWILRSRKTVRSVVSKCIICQRFKSKPATTMFAPLPEERVRMSAVFETTGVDLAGPLVLRNRDKVWIAIFTCAVYRAVHFELVSDISTQSFLLALRRFISRRGRVKTIYSDNGTNFIGANNEFKNIDWSKIVSHSDLKKISWHFNPPTAAWWGGWWERVVRMLKELLRRNLGKASLGYEELYTVVCECEAILNSRPLTYLSEEPSDLVPLTPSLFLQDQTEFRVEDLEQNVLNLRKRAKHLQSVKQKLKTRFQKEYISLLKHSRHVHQTPLEVGDMVIISSDGKKRVDWPFAKIIEIYKGRDGVSRVAKVKTENGEVVRPFQRLFRLETSGILSKTLRTAKPVKL